MSRLLAIASFLLVRAASADPLALSLEEFKMYQHYRNAMEDPRVQKMKPEARLPAIAKDAGFKLKALQQAVERGEAAGDLQGACAANVKQALEKTELSSRLGKVEVDAEKPHAVIYVQWFNENPSLLEEEAAVVASSSQPVCPIASTIQVWAQDKARPQTRIFQALISASAAQKIKPERVKDFADTRYIRLFEKVKSAAAGDDLSREVAGTSNGSR